MLTFYIFLMFISLGALTEVDPIDLASNTIKEEVKTVLNKKRRELAIEQEASYMFKTV